MITNVTDYLTSPVPQKRLLEIKFTSRLLNAAQLLITQIQSLEQLSNISTYEITLVGLKKIELKLFLNQQASIIISQYNRSRYIHGEIVTAEIQLKKQIRYYHYQIVVKTLLWRLSQTADCQIFHRKNICDLCELFLKEKKILFYRFKLFKKHLCYSYQTQYQESALNLLHRLFNIAGIFYYERHLKEKTEVIISDHLDGYHFTDYTLKFKPQNDFGLHIYRWRYQHRLFPLNKPTIRVLAHSNIHTLAVGDVFQLTDHPIKTMNQTYVIIKIWHKGHDESCLATIHQNEINYYKNIIECIPLLNHYHMPIKVITPKIYGVQIAKVIKHTDKKIAHNINGQVKVLFPWDWRETGSPFISIKQALTDSNCGMQFFPKAEDQVIIAFEQGDPNKPFVLGSLYKTEQVMPFDCNTYGIKTHHNHEIFFSTNVDDKKITLIAKGEMNISAHHHTICANHNLSVHIQNFSQKITTQDYQVQANQSIELNSANASIKMTPQKIILTGSTIDLN